MSDGQFHRLHHLNCVELLQHVDMRAAVRASPIDELISRTVSRTVRTIPVTPEQGVQGVQRIEGILDVEPIVVHRTSMDAATDTFDVSGAH